MTHKVFQDFQKSLLYYFGRKPADTTAEMNNAYEEALRDVADEDMKALLSKAYAAFKFFPSIPELKGLMGQKRRVALRNTDKCFYCMDAGLIPYTKTEKLGNITREYEYWARCPMCKAGQNYEKAPTYSFLFGEKALRKIRALNDQKYGDIQVEAERAKEYVRRFISSYGRDSA